MGELDFIGPAYLGGAIAVFVFTTAVSWFNSGRLAIAGSILSAIGWPVFVVGFVFSVLLQSWSE